MRPTLALVLLLRATASPPCPERMPCEGPVDFCLGEDACVDEQLSNHSFLFVGGAAQSGTSLVRTLASFAPGTSGMDECHHVYEGGCGQIEGALMLLKPGGSRYDKTPRSREYNAHVMTLRQLYGPTAGDERAMWLSPTHEANHTAAERARMRRYLWSSWRRFWNPDATLLVEKTSGFGGNMRRARWLAALFAPGRSVKVVSVVKNPLVNAQFERMRWNDLGCKNRATDCCYADPLRRAAADAGHDCRELEHWFATQLSYVALWADAHADALATLRAWREGARHALFVRCERRKLSGARASLLSLR